MKTYQAYFMWNDNGILEDETVEFSAPSLAAAKRTAKSAAAGKRVVNVYELRR